MMAPMSSEQIDDHLLELWVALGLAVRTDSHQLEQVVIDPESGLTGHLSHDGADVLRTDRGPPARSLGRLGPGSPDRFPSARAGGHRSGIRSDGPPVP